MKIEFYGYSIETLVDQLGFVAPTGVNLYAPHEVVDAADELHCDELRDFVEKSTPDEYLRVVEYAKETHL